MGGEKPSPEKLAERFAEIHPPLGRDAALPEVAAER